VVRESTLRDTRSVVVTFDPHPREILGGAEVRLLTTLSEKSEALDELGIDHLVVVKFSPQLSELSPEVFLSEVMIGQIGLSHLVVGYDHAIGKGASGDPETIARIGEQLGFSTEIVGPTSGPVGNVSSSGIRNVLLETGDVRLAAEQLGRRYGLSGKVVVGDGRGRKLGFPTANLASEDGSKVVPANGVYAVTVRIDEKTAPKFDGVMNIGVRPTLTDSARRVPEVHLLDFDGDLYGHVLHVSFVERVRDEKKFRGPEELRQQIQQDIVDCIAIHRSVS
jgi:riboflavin kinase/FMN adenylyltransferase